MQESLTVVSPTARAAARPKKKIVVDLLCLCIEHSRLREVLSVDTVRYVVESALGQIYREGEFRLEPLWALLSKEPGLTPEMSAAPLLAFKALEERISLRVRLPADVIGMAPLKQAELTKQVALPGEKLEPLVEELRAADAASATDLEARLTTGRFNLPHTTGRHAKVPLNPTGKTQKAPAERKVSPAIAIAAVLVVVLAVVLYFTYLR